MGEEKKDVLEKLADASFDMISGYKAVIDDYSFMKAKLYILERYIRKSKYVDKETIMNLMGWDEDGEN